MIKSLIANCLKSIYHKLPSPPSTNYMLNNLSCNPYDLLKPGAIIYDIGARDLSAPYHFGGCPSNMKLFRVDIMPGPAVDIVADAHDLSMIEDSCADCVMIISVLMYTHYPRQVMREIWRILKPGGVVYVSNPFLFPLAPGSSPDLNRFSADGVEILCEDFERIDSGFNRGPASSTCLVLIHFLSILVCFDSKMLYGLNTYLFTWLLFWIKYFDFFVGRYQMAEIIHNGSYFLGRKTMSTRENLEEKRL